MCNLTSSDDLSLIPPRRLGERLTAARIAGRMTVEQVGEASGWHFSAEEIIEIEAGVRALADHEVRFLADLLGFGLDVMRPQRAQLVLDREEPSSVVGSVWATSADEQDGDDVLVRYLALIYGLRGVKPGRFIVPRGADLEVLSAAIGSDPISIRHQLEFLMRDRRADLMALTDSLGRRVCVPPLGLLVALTTRGALILVPPPELVQAVHVPRQLAVAV